MRKIAIGLICILMACGTYAQQALPSGVAAKNGVLYFAFGTNRSFYSKSDIHFKSDDPTRPFDFTIENARAKDDGGLKFGNGGAAQYSYQIGYYFTKKNFGIEFNFDHIKYFVRHDQQVRYTGTINGQKIDKVLPVTDTLQNFEHSDGGNYALFNFVKWKNLARSKNGVHALDLMLKAGLGPVIPKTNSTILNVHYDDKYKLSGYVVALEGGVRYNFLKNVFIEPSVKGAYANYTHFLIANGEGSQKWFGLHFNLLLGAQLNL